MMAITGVTLRPGGFTLTERALDQCAFRPGDQVLDVGCGMGATVDLLRRRYCLCAIGLDRSATLISRGLERFPDLPLLVGEATRLPFPDERMDGVFMECVLSTTGAMDQVLAEAHRVLRGGGRLILTDMYLPEEQAQVETSLGMAGFRLWLWEDHTPLLKTLAAQIILEYGSLSSFWTEVCGTPQAPDARRNPPYRRLGYYLAGAVRE